MGGSVKPETIQKCFRKAGIAGQDFSVVCRQESDPFADLDVDSEVMQNELESLVGQAVPHANCCSVQEYIDGDSMISTGFENNDHWEEEFFSDLNSSNIQSNITDDEEDMEMDAEVPPLKINKLSEAIQCLEDVRLFLDVQGHVPEATSLSLTIDDVIKLQCQHVATARQSTIEDLSGKTG